MALRIIAVVTVLLTLAIASAPSANAMTLTPRVVGGTPATSTDWPFIVNFDVNQSSDLSWACGGSIIAARYVLTAAHCVLSSGSTMRAAAITGIAGRTDLDAEGGTAFGVTRISVHPLYDRTSGTDGGPYDAAILETNLDLPVDPSIVLALTADAAWYSPPAIARVAGWGLTAAGGNTGSRTLLQAELPIVSSADCATQNEITLREANSMICAGRPEGGVDTCQGDSGGPLTVVAGLDTPDPADDRRLLAGIVSWGYECAEPQRPGLYTRVATLTDWITAITSGDLESWIRAADRRAPKVTVRALRARPGYKVRLRFRIAGERYVTRETITIRRTKQGTVLKTLKSAAGVNKLGVDSYVTWRVPAAFAYGRYVWCVTSKDELGNQSAVKCSNLTIG